MLPTDKPVNYDPYYTRLLRLIYSCKEIHVFEHEGRKYKGDRIEAAKQFINDNPQPEDFSVWLQNNYTELK